MLFAARALSDETDDDFPDAYRRSANLRILDNLFESIARLLWTNAISPDAEAEQQWQLNSRERKLKHSQLSFANSVPSAHDEEEVPSHEGIDWKPFLENNKFSSPAVSESRARNGRRELFLLNKRPDNGNVLMCLLCSQNTHICDARQLVRACYPSGRGHRAEK